MAKHHGMDPNRYVVRAGKKDRKSDSDLSVRERKMLMNDLRRKLSARLGRKVSKSEMEDLLRAETNKIKLAQTNS
jgi:hypothetical protein